MAVLGFLKMVTGYPDLVMMSGWVGYCFWMYVNISCWFMGEFQVFHTMVFNRINHPVVVQWVVWADENYEPILPPLIL